MGAHTETAAYITEFSGDYKVAVFLIDPSSAVTGTVTVDEFSTIIGTMIQQAEDSVAACKGWSTSVSSNVVTCKSIQGSGATGAATPKDFYLVVIGK